MSKSRHPGAKRLSPGRYEIRITWIDRRTGQRKDRKRVIAAANLNDAVASRARLREEIKASGTTPRKRLRLREYAESWMRGRLSTIKPSTADKYAAILDRHILPSLGDFYVDSILPQDIVLWRDSQQGEASTINTRLRVVRAVLRDAEAHLGLPNDPCARVKTLPEKRTTGNRLKPDQLKRVLDHLREHEPDSYPLFLTMALTGARFGEASALTWDDIDEVEGVIRIRRSQWQGRAGSTKTNRERDVPLVEPLRLVLAEHRRRLVREQAPGLSRGLVFPTAVGTHRRNASLRKPLSRALKAAAIDERFTPHGFRRTWNNLLRRVSSGVVTRSIIGHQTEAMHFHYSHVEQDEKHGAVGRALALIDGANVEEKVEGSESEAGASNASRQQDTRND